MFPTVARSEPARAPLSLDEARQSFATTGGYLAACSIGLPTIATVQAMADDAAAWQRGDATPTDYSEIVESTRAGYAELMSVPARNVAIGSQTSVMASVIADSVPDGAEVLCPLGDFSSIVYPFLAHADRGVTLRHVPVADIAAAINRHTYLVAFSAVQSGTGEVARVDQIIESARRHGARTFCDTTQAAGWLPIDAGRFDATACNAYKWLCAPRGVAFLTLTDEFADTLRPIQAGWYAGENVWESLYGPEMTLADCARNSTSHRPGRRGSAQRRRSNSSPASTSTRSRRTMCRSATNYAGGWGWNRKDKR